MMLAFVSLHSHSQSPSLHSVDLVTMEFKHFEAQVCTLRVAVGLRARKRSSTAAGEGASVMDGAAAGALGRVWRAVACWMRKGTRRRTRDLANRDIVNTINITKLQHAYQKGTDLRRRTGKREKTSTHRRALEAQLPFNGLAWANPPFINAPWRRPGDHEPRLRICMLSEDGSTQQCGVAKAQLRF
jgi:hypothetical protein